MKDQLGTSARAGKSARLPPVPAAGRARPFWLELCVAIIFSLGALVAVSSWVETCQKPDAACFGPSLAQGPAALDAHGTIPATTAKVHDPPARDPDVRAVLSHAFAPLPLSFEDRTTRQYVLPPGQTLLDLATETARIPMDQVALIAVVQQAGVRHALVRLPDGRILRLQQGDSLDGATVAAISEDALYLMGADQQPRALVLGG